MSAGIATREPMARLFASGTRAGFSDGELIARFVERGDDLAFETLVRRHGPMVRAACRRLLTDPHDADDAFQAAFVVLARRAGSLRDREAVGPWLHGVAVRVARKARVQRARRQARESTLEGRPEPGRIVPDRQADLRNVIDEELARLPSRYRNPVVLCHLEGLSRIEAAGRLGLREGTLSSRLARARSILAGRLARRGLAPSALLGLGAALSAEARAAVPSTLIRSVLQLTTQATSIGPVAATVAARPEVAALAKGVSTGMILLKFAIGALAAFGLAAGGLGLDLGVADDTPPPGEPAPIARPKADDSLDPADLAGVWEMARLDEAPPAGQPAGRQFVRFVGPDIEIPGEGPGVTSSTPRRGPPRST